MLDQPALFSLKASKPLPQVLALRAFAVKRDVLIITHKKNPIDLIL